MTTPTNATSAFSLQAALDAAAEAGEIKSGLYQTMSVGMKRLREFETANEEGDDEDDEDDGEEQYSTEYWVERVEQDADEFVEVPKDRADYGAIALAAVAKDGMVLEFVPTDRDDYGAIALVAVAQEACALDWVPKDRADYNAIALAAVPQNGAA